MPALRSHGGQFLVSYAAYKRHYSLFPASDAVVRGLGADIEPHLADEYESYMTGQHIPDLLATGYFAAAFFAKNDDVYRIGYHADSQAQLDAYFANDADRLRADLAGHFPDGIELSRNILEIVALFPGS